MDLSNVITELAKPAEVGEADYKKDGVLYCGKCHTPKEKLIKLNGKMTPIKMPCACEAERNIEESKQRAIEREQKEKEQAKKKHAEYVSELRYKAFPDQRMKKWTFESDDRQNAYISDIAQKYVANFSTMLERGKGLLLYGTVGTGKTFISACIVNALVEEERTCLMTNFARLCNTLTGMFDGKQQFIDDLNRCELLVIDDLASERDTEYMGEIVQNIIDSRYRAELPLIVTTNLTANELKRPTDIRKERIYSRLFEMCIPIEVKGNDRRKIKLRDETADLKKLLGIKQKV